MELVQSLTGISHSIETLNEIGFPTPKRMATGIENFDDLVYDEKNDVSEVEIESFIRDMKTLKQLYRLFKQFHYKITQLLKSLKSLN